MRPLASACAGANSPQGHEPVLASFSAAVRSFFAAATALCVALAVAPAARAADDFEIYRPYSVWGGGTLESGQAIWLRGTAGLDINGLTTVQLGVSRAVSSKLDLGVGMQATVGVADALGGTLLGRARFVRRQSFRLGAELPLSVDVYPTSSEPVYIFGAEPTLLMSSYLSSRVELFYGPGARFYLIEGTSLVGPQARAGVAFYSGAAALLLAGKGSYLFVSDLTNRFAWALELAVSVRWGAGR